MKKILMTSLAVLLTVGSSSVFAQSVTWGVKAEGNLSNYILSDMDGAKSKMGFGATVGGLMKWDISEHFALQPELLFHFKASKMENVDATLQAGGNNKYSMEYWGVEIPVYAVGQTRIGNGRGYIGIGPYVGVGFSNKAYPGDVDLYDTDVLQAWDFGGAAQIGYEFRNGLSINAGYKIGFIDALDSNKDNATMLPQTVSLGLAYRF